MVILTYKYTLLFMYRCQGSVAIPDDANDFYHKIWERSKGS